MGDTGSDGYQAGRESLILCRQDRWSTITNHRLQPKWKEHLPRKGLQSCFSEGMLRGKEDMSFKSNVLVLITAQGGWPSESTSSRWLFFSTNYLTTLPGEEECVKDVEKKNVSKMWRRRMSRRRMWRIMWRRMWRRWLHYQEKKNVTEMNIFMVIACLEAWSAKIWLVALQKF